MHIRLSPRLDLLSILLAATVAGTGCATKEYVIERDAWAEAQALAASGTPAPSIAVAAREEGPDGKRLELRLSRVRAPRHDMDLPCNPVHVNAPDSARQRRAGLGLTVTGSVILTALFAYGAGEVAAADRCAANPRCLNEDFSMLIVAPILSVVGAALVIPGAAELVAGHHRRADIPPGDPRFRHVLGGGCATTAR